MRELKISLAVAIAIFFGVTMSASGQTYLIDENFEGAAFPPTGWQTSGVEWSTETSYSPTHSVKIDADGASITTPIISSPRKLEFRAWYNVTGAMVRLNYSTDGTNWVFSRKVYRQSRQLGGSDIDRPHHSSRPALPPVYLG